MRSISRSVWRGVVLLVPMALGACASYVAPGRAADFRAMGITEEEAKSMTDSTIESRLARKPAAGFPTSIAVARLQDHDYSSFTTRGYGSGRYTLVTTRDVEKEEHFKRLSSLPMVRGIAPLNRLVVPQNLDTEKDLRLAASEVQADMVLIYTFDTKFLSDKSLPIIGTITLGIFPNHVESVASTASAALLDTRTGYIYGLSEASATKGRVTNYWNTDVAIDSARRDAEEQAFDKLVGEVETMWKQVASTYGPAKAAESSPAAAEHP
jgi:hypothetical protein